MTNDSTWTGHRWQMTALGQVIGVVAEGGLKRVEAVHCYWWHSGQLPYNSCHSPSLVISHHSSVIIGLRQSILLAITVQGQMTMMTTHEVIFQSFSSSNDLMHGRMTGCLKRRSNTIVLLCMYFLRRSNTIMLFMFTPIKLPLKKIIIYLFHKNVVILYTFKQNLVLFGW